MGYPGYWETPHAYPLADGTLNLNVSRAYPYSTLSLGAQVLPRLFFAARYTSVSGREYGPGVDTQSYKDKGFDVVFHALKETAHLPSISVGLLDIGGTALFSSEYIVASKTQGPFFASLGLGWGRMGRASDLGNPLGILANSFEDERQPFDPDEQTGGDVFSENWFRGADVALFGSIGWQSPTQRWKIIAEWDGNTYDNGIARPDQTDEEASRNRVLQASRLNIGIRFRPTRNLELFTSYLRGNTVSFGFRVFEDFFGARWRDTPPLPSLDIPRLVPANSIDGWTRAMGKEGLVPVAADDLGSQHPKVFVLIDRDGGVQHGALAAARLTRASFADTTSIDVTQIRAGLPTNTLTIDEPSLLQGATSALPRDSTAVRISGTAEVFPQYPAWEWKIRPALRSNIGGAGGFFLTDLQIKPSARMQISPTTSVGGALAMLVYGNLDDVANGPPSALPPVRSNLERYQSENRALYLDSLQLDHFVKWRNALYGKVTTGILEEMYGGIHLHAMYAPTSSRLAYGVEIAYAAQRDFDQWFGFDDYRVVTGHASVSWLTGWRGVHINLSAGRYLAEDVGVTLNIARETPGGYRFGVFATKTNVSAADFGEGSFDKGLYFSIPLSALDARATRGRATFDYRFLTRDGGQKLRINRRLDDMLLPATRHAE